MSLPTLLRKAQDGTHQACKECPWSPKKIGNPAFGVSCQVHGVDWSTATSAVSIQVAQDPAGTTPEKTGRLCNVCNSQNPTDKSAQHGLDLWNATVPLAQPGQIIPDYLKHQYWTNAIMHGVNDDQRENARMHCTGILLEQINSLSPQIIIACGEVACKSLYDLGFISRQWGDLKYVLSERAYSEQKALTSGKKATVFCTYISALRVVNTHIARLYSEDTEKLILQKVKSLPDIKPAQKFLQKYPKDAAEGKGMRILFLHWLEIGHAIRTAYPLGSR